MRIFSYYLETWQYNQCNKVIPQNVLYKNHRAVHTIGRVLPFTLKKTLTKTNQKTSQINKLPQSKTTRESQWNTILDSNKKAFVTIRPKLKQYKWQADQEQKCCKGRNHKNKGNFSQCLLGILRKCYTNTLWLN